MLKISKIVLISLLTVLMTAVIILDAENMIGAVKNSINICLGTIIPSLFGFMAISSFLMKSGLYRIIFKPLYFILRFIIRLDEEEFSIFILSLIGGYPVGAKLIFDECIKNPNSSIKKILPFCYCGSPVFIISIVGISLFGRAELGLIAYLSNALANILICIFYSFSKNNGFLKFKKSNTDKVNISINQKVFTDSVMSASSSLFPVCVMVVVFGIITEALRFCGVGNVFDLFGSNTLEAYFYGFLEVSKLTLITEINTAMLPVISALTSFGGCCILMQITTITGGKIKLGNFLFLRIPTALLSGIICRLILLNINISQETASIIRIILPTETNNPVASLALLAMSGLLIVSNRKKKSIVINLNQGK